MNTLKPLLAITVLLYAVGSNAQLYSVTKTAENSAVNRANNSINNGVNQGVNAVFDAPGKIFRKVKSRSQQPQNTTVNNTPSSTTTNPNYSSSTTGPAATTKVSEGFDFTAGTEVILSDDFSSYKAGDFPDQWTTNGSGVVRSVDGQDGNWLQISTNGIFAPNNLKDFAENATLEFDALFNPSGGKDVHYIFYLYSVKEKVADFKETNYPGNAGIYFAFNTGAGEVDAENFENGKAGIIDSHLVTDMLKASLANKVHVAIAKQKSRISLYINGNRIFSSPSALPAGYTYNGIKFGSFFMGPDDFMLVSNIKVAGNP